MVLDARAEHDRDDCTIVVLTDADVPPVEDSSSEAPDEGEQKEDADDDGRDHAPTLRPVFVQAHTKAAILPTAVQPARRLSMEMARPCG